MKYTMKKSLFAAALFAVAMMVTALPARADTVTECKALLDVLRADTLNPSNGLSDKDRAGLVGKIDFASLKLDQAKFCDAIQKLNDFKATVSALAAAPKVKINQDPTNGAVTAQQLLADADAAITCINQLQINATGVGCF
jgi:hypothetical protein